MGGSKGLTTGWNHNIQYHKFVLEAVPAGCGSVVGIDRDAASITVAVEAAGGMHGVQFVHGDVMSQAAIALPGELAGAAVPQLPRRGSPGVRPARDVGADPPVGCALVPGCADPAAAVLPIHVVLAQAATLKRRNTND